MGFQDRDYERSYDTGSGWRDSGGMGGGGGFQLRMPESTINRLIVVTVIVYLVQLMSGGVVESYGVLYSDWYKQPWRFYELLTYGFLHSPSTIQHILFNMYGLWLFGTELERRYGSREILLIYLAAILTGGLAYTLGGIVEGKQSLVLGASGGTVAITVLYALLYPHRKILLFFVLPVPMWALGCLIVGGDVLNTINVRGASNIASTAHLGGAAFALAYHQFGWRLSNWLPDGFKLPSFKRRPNLRVLSEDDDDDAPRGPTRAERAQIKAEQRVDDLLKKIADNGQDSLTSSERRELEKASKRYRNRPR